MTSKIDRRSFLKKAGAAGTLAFGFPVIVPSSAFGANERIVLGVIGSGGRGRSLMRSFLEGDAVVSAVCDVYEPNLEKGLETARQKSDQVRPYTDYRRMLDEQKDMDAVVIASPDHQHCMQLVDSVDAGYDCYCEKPMSHSLKEGRKTVREVRRTDRVVQIGMQRRSSPMVRRGKEVIDGGLLGDIHHVRAKWNWHFYKTLDNSPLPGKLDVNRFIHPAKRVRFEPKMFRDWRYFWKFGGGNITDQGTHLMDVIQWYMGEEKAPVTPRMAECFGKVYKMEGAQTPDIFSSIYEYDNFLATWTLDYTSSYHNSWSIEFIGNKGTMQMDDYGWRVFDEPWKADEQKPWTSGKPPVQMEKGGIPTRPHTDNFLTCVKTREEPNAPVEIGHTAVSGPHLANIAWHKEKRAYLNADATRVSTCAWFN